MKKNSLFIYLLCALICIGFAGCSEDDNQLNVDAAYAAALTQLYPNVGRVEWQYKGLYIVADFKYNGFEKEAWFDNNAKWQMTETEYGRVESKLPAAVITSLSKGEYADWSVDDIDFYERNDISFYLIEMEKDKYPDVYLYYSPTGELLKTESEPQTEILPTTPIINY